jgi:hypothetical protein
VAVARDRQELGDALNHAEHEGFDPVHVVSSRKSEFKTR